MERNKREENFLKSNLLIVITIIVFVVALFGLIYNYYIIQTFKTTWMTGFATQSGEMNISIESSADLNLTWKSINFSSGKVTSGFQNATLCTNGTIARGNWTVQGRGFMLENIGNVNISIDMRNFYNSTTLLAGTNPYYGFNATNNLSGSCLTGTQYEFASWSPLNSTTMAGIRLCEKLYFEFARNEIKVDLWLQVPYDSKKGALNDTFVFTGTANP